MTKNNTFLVEELTETKLSSDVMHAYEKMARIMTREDLPPIFLFAVKDRADISIYYKKVFGAYAELINTYGMEKSYSKLNQINSHVLFMISHKQHNSDLLAGELLQWDFRLLLPGIDDYVEASEIKEITQVINDLEKDNEGLIKVSDDLILHKHGIVYKNTLLYYHQFLRRFFTSNFVDTTLLLKKAYEENIEVRILLDPIKISTPNRLKNLQESDYWYGDKFNKDKLNDKNFVGVTVHERGVEATRMLQSTYMIDRTIFYVKNYKNGQKELQIEELVPVYGNQGVGEKYVLHRFAHMIWNVKTQSFDHLDGSVLAYTKYDHRMRVSYHWKPPANIDVKGKRIKLFRLDGDININFAIIILSSFFRYNEMIQEYFSGIDFKNTDTYLESPYGKASPEKLKDLDEILERFRKEIKQEGTEKNNS